MKTVIAISGGGTGGHLAIAKAMMQECQKRNIPCIYIGSTSGQDQAWFENEEGFLQRYFLHTQGVVNKRGLGIIKSMFYQLKATLLAYKILKTHNVTHLFSVGGYSSAPASFASILQRIPLFIHEQNAIKGTLNTILTPFARRIFGSFGKEEGKFSLTSYPLRNDFFLQKRKRESLKKILFLGGSQGARAINDFALSIAPLLHQKGIYIIHQSGENDYERLKLAYENLKIPVELFAFSPNLAEKMHQADFCISRSGASSVWEMCASGLPALYIPYPYAAGNHQYYNALFFSQKHLGLICTQDSLSPKILDQILDLKLENISVSLPLLISPDGSKQILDSMLS